MSRKNKIRALAAAILEQQRVRQWYNDETTNYTPTVEVVLIGTSREKRFDLIEKYKRKNIY
jgi:hypothetical protein